MSFELPAGVERDVRRYAEAEHISAAEAAAKLIKEALQARKRNASKPQVTEADWKKFLDAVPGASLFEGLPEEAIDQIDKARKSTRTEKLARRA